MKTLILLVSVLFTINSLNAQNSIKVGDKAPVFKAVDENGDSWNIQEYLGKEFLVVYFYPAAMTGGCTKQACAYRDFQDEFAKLGATVVGVSGDKPEGLVYFKKAHDLNFTLLSDFDGAISKAFGVTTKKGGTIQREIEGLNVDLVRGVTSMRWTFIIDKSGKVVYIDNEVKATMDTQNTLAKIKELISKG